MATNKYIKDTISLLHRSDDLDMTDIALPTSVYSNNRACCNWAKTTTAKGLKHLNLLEIFFRECQQEDFSLKIKHISSNINCSDILNKELCDRAQFKTLRNSFMCSRTCLLQRQITFSQKTTPQSAANHTVSPRLPASHPKQSVHQNPDSTSLPLPHSLSHILPTLVFILDRLVPVQQDRVGVLVPGSSHFTRYRIWSRKKIVS